MSKDRIADLAIEAHEREAVVKRQRQDLRMAYRRWKQRHGIDRIESGSLDWIRFQKGTEKEYGAFEAAKREEKNARARLATAIRRHQNEIVTT